MGHKIPTGDSFERTRQVRMDKDGRKARSFGFAAFLQFIQPVAKDQKLVPDYYLISTSFKDSCGDWDGTSRLVFQDLHELLGSGLQEVVAHEVGHCLGLRHNFKGTMQIRHLAKVTTSRVPDDTGSGDVN